MKTVVSARALLRWGSVVGVNIALIVCVLAAAEAYLRYRGVQPYLRTFPGQHQAGASVPWARPDPALGWTIDPAFLPGQINPQGFRDTKDLHRSPRPHGITRLMLLGDSFVVGANLKPEQTLPGLLQSRLGERHEVFSVAVPGWGVDQMCLAYERYKDVVDPDLVVLAFIDDDIKRVLEAYRTAERLTKPTLTVADGTVMRQESVSGGRRGMNDLLGRSAVLSLVAREVYLATDATDVVSSIFTAIAEDMARRDGDRISRRSRRNHAAAAVESRTLRGRRAPECRWRRPAGYLPDQADSRRELRPATPRGLRVAPALSHCNQRPVRTDSRLRALAA